MAVRTVKLTLDAKVDGLVNGLKTGKKAVGDFGRDLESWRKKNEDSLDALGSSATKAGLGITAGLALAGKAAMDWESAWTGVTKTVDGSAGQMAQLEGELRGLAKTLPSTHAEIAGVAEAAGQLGVAREDITSFTKTMIDLSETTNLSADEAATGIAQFMNVMGTAGDNVDELGSALVALGNDGASTEKDIMSMATRLSGAGKLVGAAESDVLALANAMSSVGIEAELGGGVMTRVMTRMYADVKTGGDGLEELAKVSGISAAEFATAFENDPVRAVDMMVRGLEGVKESGGNVVETMAALGIKGTEETSTLLRLAGAGDLLTSSLDLGTQAWEENTALLAEAEKRYGTTEAKVTIAWNTIKDAAITAGGVLLPIIANLADGAAGIADTFGALPEPVQGFITILGGISGAGLLAVGGLVGVTKKAAELHEAFGTIQGSGGRAQKAITGVSKAISGAVVVGAAIVAGKTLIEGINEAARSGRPDLEAYFNLLTTGGGADVVKGLDLGNQGNLFSAGMLEEYSKKLGDVTTDAAAAKRAIEAMGTMDIPGIGWTQKNLSMFGLRDATEDAIKLQDAMGALGRSFEMGEIGKSQQAFADIASQLSLTDQEVATLINKVPELKSALTSVATDGGIQIDPNNELGLVDLALGRIQVSAPGAADAVGGVKAPLEDAAEAAAKAKQEVDDFYDALVNIGAIALSERDALRGLEESFDAAAEAAKKNGKTLDDTTPKGRANAAALDAIADKTLGVVSAQHDAGRSAGEMAATMEHGRAEFIKAADSMGMGAKEAGALANSLNLIPESTFMEFDTNVDGVSQRVQELYDWVKSAPDGKIQIDDNSPAVRASLESLGFVVKDLPDGKIEVSEKGADATGKKIDGVAGKQRKSTITTDSITGAVEAALNYLARDRNSTIHTRFTSSGESAVHRGGSGGQLGNYMGGRLPYRANGGRLPYTGLGRDMILGVGSDGRPTANVDDGEWVIRESMSSKHDGLLRMINSNDPRIDKMKSLVGLKSGGRVGWSQGEDAKARRAAEKATRERKEAEKDLKASEKAYDRISGKKENKAAKAAAKRRRDKDKRDLDAAKKAEDEAKKDLQDSKARTARLSEDTFDLRRETKRGEFTEAFTSGSGMQIVDRAFEASNNKDLSKKQRAALRSWAYKTEDALLKLEKRAESTGKKLESAREKRDDLLSIRDGVAGGLRGETTLGGLIDEHQATRYGKVTAAGIASLGRSKVAKMREFGTKLDALRKKGYGGAVIQEIAEMGTEAGMEAANILLAGSTADRNAINAVYKDLETQANRAGNYVTDALSKGGLNAAQSLVDQLAKEEGNIEKAFYNLGLAGQKGFHRAWGIASPSKEAKKDAKHIVDGSVLGIKAEAPRFAAAMEGMYAMPDAARYAVPAYVPAQQMVQPAAAAITQVRVFIGNEEFTSRMTTVAEGVVEVQMGQTARRVAHVRR